MSLLKELMKEVRELEKIKEDNEKIYNEDFVSSVLRLVHKCSQINKGENPIKEIVICPKFHHLLIMKYPQTFLNPYTQFSLLKVADINIRKSTDNTKDILKVALELIEEQDKLLEKLQDGKSMRVIQIIQMIKNHLNIL